VLIALATAFTRHGFIPCRNHQPAPYPPQKNRSKRANVQLRCFFIRIRLL